MIDLMELQKKELSLMEREKAKHSNVSVGRKFVDELQLMLDEPTEQEEVLRDEKEKPFCSLINYDG